MQQTCFECIEGSWFGSFFHPPGRPHLSSPQWRTPKIAESNWYHGYWISSCGPCLLDSWAWTTNKPSASRSHEQFQHSVAYKRSPSSWCQLLPACGDHDASWIMILCSFSTFFFHSSNVHQTSKLWSAPMILSLENASVDSAHQYLCHRWFILIGMRAWEYCLFLF